MLPPADPMRSPLDHSYSGPNDSDPKPQSLLDTAVSNIVQAIGGRAGFIRLWDDHPQREVASSSYGLSEQAIVRLRPLVDDLLPKLEDELGGPTIAELDRAAVEGLESAEPFRAIALPLRARGRLIGLLCLFQSTTDLQLAPESGLHRLAIEQVDVVIQNARMLERLVEEKRWLEAVVRYSADGILILDGTGRIVGMNPAFERLVGWPVEEVRGRLCRDVLEPRTRSGAALCPELCPLLGGRVGPDGTATIELTYRRKAGTRVNVEVNYAVIRNERGRVLGAIVGARDITARREAEDLQNTFLSVISHELQTPITIIQGYAELLGDPEVELPRAELRQKLGIIQEESQRLQKMVDNILTASRLQTGAFELLQDQLDLAQLY